MPKLPFGFSGGFSAILAMTFLPENLEIHDYHIDATGKDAETATIGFSTRANQQKFHFVWNDESVLSNDIGKAWVDVKTRQVVRLERNFLNLPRGLSRFSTTIEYGPSMIGDRQFWLPRTILTEMTDRDPKKTGKFIAKYNDCKKFTADVKFSQQ